ncbi:MAG: PIN domain-containing protein [Deltaproteobacteria bacterium]|nr:PIN domain-containing protein [Deltaproteobacteria bacterium]
MDRILIDSSAWIAAFRGNDPAVQQIVDRLLETDRAVLCGVVEMELLHGMRQRERFRLLPLFGALPFLEIDRTDWQTAGRLLSDLRSRGKTIPATDALLSALCLRHDVALLTLDKHFDEIPTVRRYPATD